MDFKIENNNPYLEGCQLTDEQIKMFCAVMCIPYTIYQFDIKYGSDLMSTALKAVSIKPSIIQENNRVLAVVPKGRTFVDLNHLESFSRRVFPDLTFNTVNDSTLVSRPIKCKDLVVGDVFYKEIQISSRFDGGLNLNLNLVREICTNGCMIHERGLTQSFSTSQVNKDSVINFINRINKFDFTAYIRSKMFDSDGAIPADLNSLLLFYEFLHNKQKSGINCIFLNVREKLDNMGVDICKVSLSERKAYKLDISYYDLFNILTADCRGNQLSLSDKIQVGNFIKLAPRRQHISKVLNTRIEQSVLSSLKGNLE